MGTAMQVLYMKFWDFIGAEAAVNLLSQKNQSIGPVDIVPDLQGRYHIQFSISGTNSDINEISNRFLTLGGEIEKMASTRQAMVTAYRDYVGDNRLNMVGVPGEVTMTIQVVNLYL